MLNTATIAAAVALLAASVSSMPNLHPRVTDSPQPWVTVGDDGKPTTVTPVLTTISGVATVISGAPNDLTATVFTQTNYGQVTTSTGTAPAPTATATDGAGSFTVCNNKNGANAPWFIWDATYFAAGNTTILIQGNYLNATTGAITSQAFKSDRMAASWGFWSLAIDSALMQGGSATNISVQIAALNMSGSTSQIIGGPTILVTNPPIYHQPASTLPTGAALYIGLPTIFGFVVLCLLGTFLWNRKYRKINLGNIMSRNRHGYGVGKSARSRMGLGKARKDKLAAERVELMEREVAASGGQVYRDDAPTHIDIPRRDSDALGSLAGTPTEERRMDFHRPSTRDGREKPAAGADGNLFRDELRRQAGEKF